MDRSYFFVVDITVCTTTKYIVHEYRNYQAPRVADEKLLYCTRLYKQNMTSHNIF